MIHRRLRHVNGIDEKGLELTPPTGECCAGAPPVLEFDQAGDLLNHWGGPGQGYEWPSSNHGITVDYKGNVWVGGNGEGDASSGAAPVLASLMRLKQICNHPSQWPRDG